MGSGVKGTREAPPNPTVVPPLTSASPAPRGWLGPPVPPVSPRRAPVPLGLQKSRPNPYVL